MEPHSSDDISPSVREAYLAATAYVRRLDEGPLPHRYFEWVDVEGLAEEGQRYLWEAVEDTDGELVAVKQLEISTDGRVECYWWRRMSGLTDQALDPAEPEEAPITSITREQFYAEWNRWCQR